MVQSNDSMRFTVFGGRYDGLPLIISLKGRPIPEDGDPIRFDTAWLEHNCANIGPKTGHSEENLPPVTVFLKEGKYLIPCGFEGYEGVKYPDPEKN